MSSQSTYLYYTVFLELGNNLVYEPAQPTVEKRQINMLKNIRCGQIVVKRSFWAVKYIVTVSER